MSDWMSWRGNLWAKSTAVDEFSDSIGEALELVVVVLDLPSCIVERSTAGKGRGRTEVCKIGRAHV